jgi:hypothetical protein
MNRQRIATYCAGWLCLLLVGGRTDACDCGACGGVILNLEGGVTRFASPGQYVYLGANATDYDTVQCLEQCGETQNIESFEWQVPPAMQSSGGGCIPDLVEPAAYRESDLRVWSNTPGRYTVWVGASDNDGHSSYAAFTVWVIDIGLTINEAVIGIGGLAEVTLTWSPTGPIPPGCFELYTDSMAGGDSIRVWETAGRQNELLSPPEDSYVLSTSRFPHPVWLEGVKAGYGAHLYFEYRPYCNQAWYPLADWGEDIVRVVEAYQIEQIGTGLTGPLYVVCPDDTIQLQVSPWPSEGPWPAGEPHWEVISCPDGATPALTPSSGSATTTVSGFNKPGYYIVWAKCGELDDGDGIIIITPPPANRFRSFDWSFHCPTREGEASSKAWPDDCGNEVSVVCQGSPFHFYYKPTGGTRTQVGQCIWAGGQNEFYCWYHEAPDGRERFLELRHVTVNDAVGVDSDGEGCKDFCCWRVQRHNCVANTEIGHWWRKCTDPDDAGWDENNGVPCLGQDGAHGAIPLYPN